MPCYDHLEHSNTGSSLTLPVFGVWIQALQNIERLRGVVKLAHLQEISVQSIQSMSAICLYIRLSMFTLEDIYTQLYIDTRFLVSVP